MGAEGIKPLASLNAGMLGRGGGSRRVPLTFAPLEPASDDVAVELPEVVQQVARLARALGIDVPADPVVPPVAEAADTGRRRIAFTLRLDAQRHGRLRAIAVAQARSAQQVLVDAFDRYQAGATGHAADLPATAPSHRKAPTGNQP
jgi:hypothetical protein